MIAIVMFLVGTKLNYPVVANFETDLGAPADLFKFNVPTKPHDEQGKRKWP